MQAVLARGDRQIGEALLEAHVSSDPLKFVLKQRGVNIEELACAELAVGQPLPWQHLDMGFTEQYLVSELEKSAVGKFTPMCFEGCKRCGVCR